MLNILITSLQGYVFFPSSPQLLPSALPLPSADQIPLSAVALALATPTLLPPHRLLLPHRAHLSLRGRLPLQPGRLALPLRCRRLAAAPRRRHPLARPRCLASSAQEGRRRHARPPRALPPSLARHRWRGVPLPQVHARSRDGRLRPAAAQTRAGGVAVARRVACASRRQRHARATALCRLQRHRGGEWGTIVSRTIASCSVSRVYSGDGASATLSRACRTRTVVCGSWSRVRVWTFCRTSHWRS